MSTLIILPVQSKLSSLYLVDIELDVFRLLIIK